MKSLVWLPLVIGMALGATGCGGDDDVRGGRPLRDQNDNTDGEGGGAAGNGGGTRPIRPGELNWNHGGTGYGGSAGTGYGGSAGTGEDTGGSGGGYYKQEKCGDQKDNDQDGLTDCDDPDCADDVLCTGEEVCNDGVDNDGDCFIDCDDPDCAESAYCTAEEEVCNDYIDNDGDNLVDCYDPDCADDAYCTPPAEEICNDWVDNDGDNLVDCYDPDCAYDPYCTPPAEEVCNDYVDNDGDYLTDCADPDCAYDPYCTPPAQEVCNDYVDNDGDYLVDCADPDCAYDPYCQEEQECRSEVSCFDISREKDISFVLVSVPCPDAVERITLEDLEHPGHYFTNIRANQPSHCDRFSNGQTPDINGFKIDGVSSHDVRLCITTAGPLGDATIQVKAGLVCSEEDVGTYSTSWNQEMCECEASNSY